MLTRRSPPDSGLDVNQLEITPAPPPISTGRSAARTGAAMANAAAAAASVALMRIDISSSYRRLGLAVECPIGTTTPTEPRPPIGNPKNVVAWPSTPHARPRPIDFCTPNPPIGNHKPPASVWL